ncbi:UNVERIFIED_CONTAM: hypothetical protein K2H54_033674 [Gekko kuhli]
MHAPRALLSAVLLACGCFWGELPGCQQATIPPPDAMRSRRLSQPGRPPREARKPGAPAAAAEPHEYMLALLRTDARPGAPRNASAAPARAANTVTSFVDRGRGLQLR